MAHVPLEFATIDLCSTVRTGANCVALQGSAAAWAMQRRRLRRRRGKQISLALKFPAFANVIGHLGDSVALLNHFSVIRFKSQAHSDHWCFQPIDLSDLH